MSSSSSKLQKGLQDILLLCKPLAKNKRFPLLRIKMGLSDFALKLGKSIGSCCFLFLPEGRIQDCPWANACHLCQFSPQLLQMCCKAYLCQRKRCWVRASSTANSVACQRAAITCPCAGRVSHCGCSSVRGGSKMGQERAGSAGSLEWGSGPLSPS